MSLFKPMKGDSSRISLDVTPFQEGYCYYTTDDGGFYIDSVDENGVQKRTRINPKDQRMELTLGKDGWTDGLQTLPVDGLSKDRDGFILVAPDATDEQMEAACEAKLRIFAQDTGSLTIAARGDIPGCDIPVTVILSR